MLTRIFADLISVLNISTKAAAVVLSTESRLSRNEKLLLNCDINTSGLEIGPSYNPIAAKAAGYRVDILDHADARTLREKYKDHNVDLSRIEEVDYVWSGQALHDLTKKTDHYDWIIASHVIEHTPDLVSFLIQCELMLKPGGILSLAVPDHRYCFDVFRPVSTSGDVIQAFIEKRRKHSAGAIFDHFSMGAKKNGTLAWNKGVLGEYSLIHDTVKHAQAVLAYASSSDEYIDIHNWRFTPSSFKLTLADIHALGYVSFTIKTFFETEGFEFVCQLQKNTEKEIKTASNINRLDLLMDIAKEAKATSI